MHNPSLTTRKQRLIAKIECELGDTITDALRDPQTIEVLLNPDSSIWQERLGKPMQNIGALDPVRAESAMKTIASYCDSLLTRENPTISCELPIDGSRFQGMIPPVVRAPSFAIRKKAINVFTLDEYEQAKIITPEQKKRIQAAVKNHENILIAGSTGSGKTTLTNGIIVEMVRQNSDERILIMEDTAEIQCLARNALIMRSTAQTSLLALLQSTMRLRPDRILIGEVRGREAWTLIKAWNTGHPGGIATLHANNAKAGLLRLEQLSAEDPDAPRQAEYLRGVIAESIDLVVYISKTARGRQVKQLLDVTGYANSEYVTQLTSTPYLINRKQP